MKQSRILQTRDAGHFVTLILACRHSVRLRRNWWGGSIGKRTRFIICPQCNGK